jgi:CHAT domain-containing protein
MASRNREFNDFCDSVLPKMLKESEKREAERTRNLRGLQATLSDLGPGTVLVHTLAAENELFLVLTTPGSALAKSSPIGREELAKKARAFRALLNDPLSDPRPAAKELHDLIIGPLAEELDGAGAKTVMFSLDGPLRYVPMAALHDGEKWFAETRASVLFVETAKHNLKDLPDKSPAAAAFGVSKAHGFFPALDEVPRELRAVIRSDGSPGAANGVLDGRFFLDEGFTRDSLKRGLRGSANVAHIASHFQFLVPGGAARDNSYLLLGDGSRLTVADIKDELDLGGLDLLTLSACNTAAGIASGEGAEVESMGNVILSLGAKAVLATLWPVNDVSTALFMSDFYRFRYGDDSADKAESLRLAQLALMRSDAEPESAERGRLVLPYSGTSSPGSPEGPAAPAWDGEGFSHPFYWAPFVVMGNFR